VNSRAGIVLLANRSSGRILHYKRGVPAVEIRPCRQGRHRDLSCRARSRAVLAIRDKAARSAHTSSTRELRGVEFCKDIDADPWQHGHRTRRPVIRPRSAGMDEKRSNLRGSWWAKNLDNVDQEIARLATICNVRVLDPGVIERVLGGDESVCGTRNPVAFGKLRDMLKMHYHIRTKAVEAVGEQATARIIEDIVEHLRQRIGDRLGGTAR
jgi:hypothetical protein